MVRWIAGIDFRYAPADTHHDGAVQPFVHALRRPEIGGAAEIRGNRRRLFGLLIRAAQPLTGLELMAARRGTGRPEALLSGPGKLCQGLGISKEHYGVDLLAGGPLRLEVGPAPERIMAGPRIGLAIGKGHETPWRFVDADAGRWVSH